MNRYKDTLFSISKNSKYFEEAISFTFDRSGFLPYLIEKDYYCSLILNYLYQDDETDLVFKGGTCLSKVYANFYRMSEDLDFVIPAKPEISRKERSQLIEPIKKQLAKLIEENNCFSIKEKFKGSNVSKQYIGVLSYNSVIESAKKTGEIKIEIGLREELIQDANWIQTSTLLIDPFRETEVIPKFKTQCLTIEEVYSEKFRAALSRREPAIRDFYDIFYATQNLELDFISDSFLSLVKTKLAIPGNEPVIINPQRKKQLLNQIDTELKSVLRNQDLAQFDFESVYDLVEKVSKKIDDL
jgi:predicted nucleotidyltransferase component of viral defense system